MKKFDKSMLNDERVKKAFDSLDENKKSRLNEILNDEQELNRIMNTPQAQLLLKKIMEQDK
ncbi:MAG: hypothetical protein ACI4QV_03925 [Acutalibacteraceae bacterium]